MKVLGSSIDFQTNKYLFFTEYRDYFTVLVVSALLDATSTYMFMTIHGIEVESNPLIRVFAFKLGIVAGPFIGKILQVLAVWEFSIITPRLTKFVASTTILINLAAFMINCDFYFRTA